MKLSVIHFASDSDLPQSVRDKVTDSVAQTVFRQALNQALADGKSEMHGFISAYKALESAGYARNENDNWVAKHKAPKPISCVSMDVVTDPDTGELKLVEEYAKQGGPCGIGLPGEPEPNSEDYMARTETMSATPDEVDEYMQYLEGIAKSTPTASNVHVNRPLGSEEKEDDPGTQFVNPDQVELLGATIQNPYDARDRNTSTTFPQKAEEEKDDDPGTQDVDPPHPNYAGAPNYAAITSFQGSGNQDPTFIYHKVAKRISGSSNIHLNKEGVALAAKLGVRIADKGCLDILYSSPLNRGKETAHQILEACPHTTYAKPNAAIQPWHLGAFEGQGGANASDGISHYVDNPDERPPGKGRDDKPAETFNESKTRQLTFWKDLYDDWQNDPTLKIGVVCHSRGLALLQAWVADDCPADFDVDTKDIKEPDKDPHATVYRWHKDDIKQVDVENDEPLKPGIYPILHSLTDDDSDAGNKDLKKVQYLPPIEVQRAAKSAYDAGCAVIDITAPLSDGSGLTEDGIREVAKHFEAVESATDTENARNAWGGPLASKWAQRVMKKIQRDYPQCILVDLDNTLAKPLESYDGTKIGDPKTGKFFDKVKQAVEQGKPVRIFTARVAHDPDGKIADAIKAWTLKHLGKELPVTNEKDPGMTELWDDKAHTPDEITKGDSSVMVAFTIDPKTANKLKVKDGEVPSDMHVTLLYIKEITDDQIKSLTTMLKGFAATFAPIDATLRGPTRFSASAASDGKDVCVAAVESLSLHKFREDLLNKAESLGIEVSKNFSYTPHVTLKYIDPKDDLPVQRIDPTPITFKAVSFYDANNKIKDFPLSGTAVAKTSGQGTIIECVSQGDSMWAHVSCDDGTRVALQFNESTFDQSNYAIQIGAQVRWDNSDVTFSDGREFPLVGVSKSNTAQDFSFTGQVVKLDTDHHLVFGWFSIVQIDGKEITDTQGDIISPETIEFSAYDYVLHARKAGEMHQSGSDGTALGVGRLVESVVFTHEKQTAILTSLHDQGIKDAILDLRCVGWFGGFRIDSDEVWDKIQSGELRSFSIGGCGKRAAR